MSSVVIGMLVAVKIVGGAQPEAVLQPAGIMPIVACEQLVAQMNGLPPASGEVDKKGRPVLQSYHTCLLVSDVDVAAALAAQASK